MPVIAVVDYNMGNLRSVTQALQHVAPSNATIDVTSTPEDIYAADYVVFPGQGAAQDCMSELQKRDLIGAIKDAAQCDSNPFVEFSNVHQKRRCDR